MKMSSRPKRWRSDCRQPSGDEELALEDAGGDNPAVYWRSSASMTMIGFGIIMPMTPPDEHDVKVVRMFMGTRADLVPQPVPLSAFEWECQKCQAKTYSIAEPPSGSTCICNACASQLTAQVDQDSSTLVRWGMTNELEDSVRKIAGEKKRPVEEVFNRFLEWKLRKPMNPTADPKSQKKNPKE
jgi:hypothetical protein